MPTTCVDLVESSKVPNLSVRPSAPIFVQDNIEYLTSLSSHDTLLFFAITMSKSSKPKPEEGLTAGFFVAHGVSLVTLGLIIKEAVAFSNATEALAFYGVYHREPGNQLIHFFGVPGILWSGIIFMVHLDVPVISNNKAIQSLLPASQQFTYGIILAMIYLVFYLHIDPFGGSLYAPILYGMYTSACHLHQQDQRKSVAQSWAGTGKLLRNALILHIFSWYIQIHWGHKVIEGAQPAVLQSIGGALTVAPLFAYYEFLWLIGLNQDLQMQTLTAVQEKTMEICAAGNTAMRVCETLASS